MEVQVGGRFCLVTGGQELTKAAKMAKAANISRITPLRNLVKSVRTSGVGNLTSAERGADRPETRQKRALTRPVRQFHCKPLRQADLPRAGDLINPSRTVH